MQHIFWQTKCQKHIHDFLCIIFSFLHLQFLNSLGIRHPSKLYSIWRILICFSSFRFFQLILYFYPNVMNVFYDASIEIFINFSWNLFTFFMDVFSKF